MDPVTHALVGAAVAGCVYQKAEPRRAMLTGGVAALLPDLDVFLQKSSDPLFQLELHRQFSHALTTFPLVAALVAAPTHRLSKARFSLGQTFVAALLGLLSAGLLDACTSYGTQLLWPWSSHRFAFNVVPVVDPLFTIVLLALTVVAFRGSKSLGRVAPALWLGLYLTHGAVQHGRAYRAIQEELVARGEHPPEIVLKPTLGNQILWRAVYLQESTVRAVAVRTGWRVTTTFGEARPLWVLSAELGELRGTHVYSDLERFSALSDHYLVAHPDRPEVIGDARYAMLPTSLSPLWGLEIDKAHPERPARFVTFRDSGLQVRQEFWRQLVGRSRVRSDA